MAATKKFLLMLVLACVTCLVLIQISMNDEGPARGGKYSDPPPQPLPMDTDADLTRNVKPNSPVPFHKDPQNTSTESVIKTTSTSRKPVATTRSTTIQPTKRTVPINNTHNVVVQSQVRRLPLAKQVSSQNLVNRQERLQEILKQGNALHRRTVLDPLRSLNSIPLVDPNKVTRIIVITYFRAGSSFFGDILQQNWKTFYHFEPLHSMTYNKRIDDDKIPEVFSLFNNIFTCNFSQSREYMRWVKQPRNQFLFAHNLFLWVTCHSSPKVCFNPSFVSSVCQRAPVHVVKVTRLHMRHLHSYLESNPDLNVKVVHLTRDPRGIVSSRWSLDWCNGTNCSDPGVLCGEMDEDIDIFNELKRSHPSNFIQVRYEDLSLNPESESEKLFRFLNLPFSTSVKKFLKTHTVGRKSDDKNPYSTRRNSTSMVFSWRERFTYNQILDVQSRCEDVLHKLNHSTISSPQQLPYPYGKPKLSTTARANSGITWRFHKNPLAQKYLAHRPEYALENNLVAPNSHQEHLVFIPNNTNIEVHKTYKIVDRKKSAENLVLNNRVR